MEFEEIPKIMKRYKFDAIMNKCSFYACQIMGGNGLDIHASQNIYPWELEAIALFGLMSTEKNDSHTFEDKYHHRKFIKMIGCLREYKHPKLNIENPDLKWATQFMMVTGLIQFSSQEDIRYKLFRYNYLFNFSNNKLDLKEEFKKIFGVKYHEFQVPCQAIYVLLSLKKIDQNFLHNAVNRIINKHGTVLKQLVIHRDDFIEKQAKILDATIDNYYYSFKYFYQYPFIEYESKIYLPLPYLIINAITDSFLFRITENNNSLREKIGKEAIESYLLKILQESNSYDELFPELTYKKGRDKRLTSDALARIGHSCILFDSKSSVPKVTLRNFDEDSFNKAIDIYSDAIVQIYKRIQDFDLYNPFDNSISIYQKDIYGIIVVLEDNNISRDIIFEASSDKLNLHKNTPEWEYLRSNLIILPLKDIEQFALNSKNILSELINIRDDKQKWNDFCLDNSISTGTSSHTKEFDKFIDKMKSGLDEIVQDLIDAGIVQQ